MSLECTTEDCQNHTSTYLCGQCVADLQAWIDKVPPLIEALYVTIAKLDNVRSAGGGGGGGSKPGSKAPINLDASELRANLMSVGTDAKAYAHDERAAGLAWLIQDWATKAELLVSGPEAETINHAKNAERVKGIAPAMPTRQLLPWLREKAGIHIKGQQIRDWARRGKLKAATSEPSPTYHPHEVLAAWHQTRKEEAR